MSPFPPSKSDSAVTHLLQRLFDVVVVLRPLENVLVQVFAGVLGHRGASVPVVDGEEGRSRIVRQREDVGVRVLHVYAPPLHAGAAHAVGGVLAVR